MNRKVSKSRINKFYKNKSILITGVTGFVAKVILYKLLLSFYGYNLLLSAKSWRSFIFYTHVIYHSYKIRVLKNHILLVLYEQQWEMYILSFIADKE